MPYIRPTLQTLIDQTEQDFISRLGITGASTLLRRAMARVLARVWAGALHLLYGFIQYTSNQIFPDVSDSAFLIRQAALFGQTPLAATYAHRSVTATGTNGSVIPATSVLTASDGTVFTSDADATISSGMATVAITASLAGTSGNSQAGDTLTFQSPPAGVSATVTVLAGGVDGTDAEDTDSGQAFSQRFIEYLQAPPHGGNSTDYVAWAKQVAGVTRAWVYPQELGAGTVSVRFVRDNDVGGPIPSGGEVTAVQSYIDALRPVTADVTVLAPVADPVNYTLHIVPDTTATRAAVTAELQDFHTRNSAPGVNDLISQIELSVGLAAGITNFLITAPAGDVTHTSGKIGTLGTISFI